MSDIRIYHKGDFLNDWETRLHQTLEPLEIWYDFRVRPGFYLQNGAVALPGGVSFTVYSEGAYGIDLLLFHKDQDEPYAIIPFPEKYRVGDVYSMIVFDLDIADLEYALRLDGPYDPQKGLLFDKRHAVIDPYARKVIVRTTPEGQPSGKYPYRAAVVVDTFDWGRALPPKIRQDEMIIYEMHVKGFTQSPSAGVENGGTFAGLIEKIPYLKKLGVNVVELMPIFEFDSVGPAREFEGNLLYDYWGYNPVSFFAPNSEYSSEGEMYIEGQELKQLVRELHSNGIEVFLDVVFNHTAEGDERGPYINFRGFDNNIYYMLTPEGFYFNFSGCGNTLNANHPIVRQLILDCLRYWVTAYHIDGFRFDLASILGRNEDGSPMSDPPLLESLAYDPILKNVELIAEAWDAGGLYQVGSFPSWNRWAEWNGRYRDDLRCFLKGDYGMARTAAERITGSRDLYPPENRGKHASVNFITCHDGFTLNDLYSYNEKHNIANGWGNTDGENSNNSWNCGAEGDTNDPHVLELRQRMMLNACVVLLASIGTPMLLAGDEFRNTQFGNNNPYCQDNEISWLDWTLLEKNKANFEFWRKMIRFRKHHPVLRGSSHVAACGLPEISTHGMRPWFLDDSPDSHYVGVMYAGRDESGRRDEVIYLAVNAGWERCTVLLPDLPHHEFWHQIIDTSLPLSTNFVEDVYDAPILDDHLVMEPRSTVLLLAYPLQSWKHADEARRQVEQLFIQRQKGRSNLFRYHLQEQITSGAYTPWALPTLPQNRRSGNRPDWHKYLPKKSRAILDRSTPAEPVNEEQEPNIGTSHDNSPEVLRLQQQGEREDQE